MKCDKCGKDIVENVGYCPSCKVQELQKDNNLTNLNSPIDIAFGGLVNNQDNNNIIATTQENQQVEQVEMPQPVMPTPKVNNIHPLPTDLLQASNAMPTNQIQNQNINNIPIQPVNESVVPVSHTLNNVDQVPNYQPNINFKKWPYITTLILLLIAIIMALLMGPGLFVISLGAGEAAWIIGMIYFPYVLHLASIALILFSLINIFTILSAQKYSHPNKVLMLSSGLLAIASTVMIFRIIRQTINIYVFIIVLGIVIIYSVIILITCRKKNKQYVESQKNFISPMILIVLTIINIVILGMKVAPDLWYQLESWRSMKEYNKQVEDEIIESQNNSEFEISKELASMARDVCYGKYVSVFASKTFKNQGFFECEENNKLFFLNDTKEKFGSFNSGKLYEIGYTKYDEVESVFPNEIYLFYQTDNTDYPSELKMALVAQNEQDFLDKYAEKFYQLIKNMNSQYWTDVVLIIYFNNTLSGIESSYDRLFLSAKYYMREGRGMMGSCQQYGNSHCLTKDGDPGELLKNIFDNPNNYPTNARNALKNNRHIELEIKDGHSITKEDFMQRFTNAYQERL